MKTETKTTTTGTAFGVKLDKPIPYTIKWENYESFEELVAAGKALTEEDQVKVRNTEAMAAARTKAMNDALNAAGYFKQSALDNDEHAQLKEMFRLLMVSKKYTIEKARELAEMNVGAKWADFEG